MKSSLLPVKPGTRRTRSPVAARSRTGAQGRERAACGDHRLVPHAVWQMQERRGAHPGHNRPGPSPPGGRHHSAAGSPVTITLAVANQKGGVAKTTTVASLGAALVEMGQRVLLVDLDPQACLTFSLGLDPDALELSVHDVLLGRVPAAMALQETDDGIDPAAGGDRPDRLRGAAGHQGRARVRPARGAGRRLARLRLGAHRLLALARRAHPQRADRGRRGASSRCSARPCRTAAWGSCWRPSTRSASAPTPSSTCSGSCRPCTTAAPRTPAPCSPTSPCATPCPCSSRRCPSPSASPRRRPPAVRSCAPRRPHRAPRRTASTPGTLVDGDRRPLSRPDQCRGRRERAASAEPGPAGPSRAGRRSPTAPGTRTAEARAVQHRRAAAHDRHCDGRVLGLRGADRGERPARAPARACPRCTCRSCGRPPGRTCAAPPAGGWSG